MQLDTGANDPACSRPRVLLARRASGTHPIPIGGKEGSYVPSSNEEGSYLMPL